MKDRNIDRVIVTKTAWYWLQRKKHIHEWYRIEVLEISPCGYSHLILYKGAKIHTLEKRQSFL
jgi:hypothetical protein